MHNGMGQVDLTWAVLFQVDTMLLVLDLNLQQNGAIDHASEPSTAVPSHHKLISFPDPITVQSLAQSCQSLRFDVIHLIELTCRW